jgi:hypothetical protein
MKTLTADEHGKPISVPREVATCPICDADIVIDGIDGWECENGKPVGISLECVTEPDIDGDEWEDWFHGHWSTPYVDWLPVKDRVLCWFQKHFRCASILILVVLLLGAAEPQPSPWRCEACGRSMRLDVNLKPYHIGVDQNHPAKLSRADLTRIVDGLRLSGPTIGPEPVKPKPKREKPKLRVSDPMREA